MKPDDPKWINWPFETLERQMAGEPLKGLGYRIPPWLEIVQARVIEECFGRIIGIEDKPDPFVGGFLCGWIDRSWRDIEDGSETLEKIIQESEPLQKIIEDHEDEVEFEPLTDEELEDIQKAKEAIEEHYSGNKEGLTTEELIQYSSGYNEGLKGTHGENHQYFAGRLKTDLFVILWIFWPIVMHHPSSTVTWLMLCALRGHDQIGDLEAFRQLLKRHKIKIGKRGRPTKKK